MEMQSRATSAYSARVCVRPFSGALVPHVCRDSGRWKVAAVGVGAWLTRAWLPRSLGSAASCIQRAAAGIMAQLEPTMAGASKLHMVHMAALESLRQAKICETISSNSFAMHASYRLPTGPSRLPPAYVVLSRARAPLPPTRSR
jgi:hypothetical protein